MTCSPRSLAGWLLAAAVTVAGCSDNNNSNTPTGLQPPTGLTVTQSASTTAHVSWTPASGATGYLVQRATSVNPTAFTTLGNGTVSGTSFDDSGLASGTNYIYQVASVSSTDTSSFSAPVNFSLTGSLPGVITGPITASRTLFSDTVYTLSGYVKVQNGATLTVQPGTKIVGDTTVPGSSLWILRGAKIDAEGTADAPIVFTSARSPGNRKPGDWGGIIIIGNGIINRSPGPILTEGGAAGQAEDYSGGTDNNDNSGVLRYVRIEFAGYDISNGAGQELNSLSSYAVGRGTTYEYLQTMSGLDDSFEYWGGAVDGRYLVSYESGDDHYDWTEGYQGRNQFLIAFQSQKLVPAPGTGVFSSDPRGFEGDGCDPAVSGCTLTGTTGSQPYSMPVWANFTLIGTGQNPDIPADGNGAVLRRGTGGTLFNGILGRWKGIAIDVRDTLTKNNIAADSLNFGNLILAQNGFNFDTTGANFGDSTTVTSASGGSIRPYASTVSVDTLLGINLTPTSLDWTPKAGSPATTGGSSHVPSKFGARTGSFFGAAMPQTSYVGAADPAGAKWWQGWTAYNIN